MWHGFEAMSFGRVRQWGMVAGVVLGVGCVSPPEATREGGDPCVTEADCNPNGLCGPVRLCVLGYCAQDTVFRACPDGGYRDASPVGECLTYINCNAATCGALVPCVNNRCDRTAPPVRVPCDDAGF